MNRRDEQLLKISNMIDEHTTQLKILEEFISLYIKKDQIADNLMDLQNKLKATNQKLTYCRNVVHNYINNSLVKYQNLTKKIRMQELTIFNILTELKKRKKCVQKSTLKGLPTLPNHKSVLKNKPLEQISAIKKCETPKMSLNDYAASPYVRKVRPIPFQFLDFEFNITSEMFDTIPKYMRGRETVEELKSFFENTIVLTFNEKYQLLHRQRDAVRNLQEIELWKTYQDQKSYFPGQKFITEGDLCRKTNKMVDKKSKNRITMLKHLALLQEQRNGKTICYIWIAASDRF